MIVVTGASGFVGRAVIAALASRGAEAFAVSRRPTIFKSRVSMAHVSDYAMLDCPTADSVLVHLAEPRDISTVEPIGGDPSPASSKTLGALLRRAWKHVVYISSAAVYGDQSSRPSRPDDVLNPRNAYAKAKVICERQVLGHGGSVVRLANVYGPGMAQNNVLSDILANIPGVGALAVRDMEPVRDYVWVEDVARGISDLATSGLRAVINLGTGRGTSVGELAQLTLQRAGEGHRPVISTEISGGKSSLVVDISQTTKLLGWSPTVSLEFGVASLLSQTR